MIGLSAASDFFAEATLDQLTRERELSGYYFPLYNLTRQASVFTLILTTLLSCLVDEVPLLAASAVAAFAGSLFLTKASLATAVMGASLFPAALIPLAGLVLSFVSRRLGPSAWVIGLLLSAQQSHLLWTPIKVSASMSLLHWLSAVVSGILTIALWLMHR